MNKGLEALKEKYLKLLYGTNTPISMEETLLFANIEQELKRLEELDNGAYVSIHINRYNELCDKEEALEIIKKNGVNILNFMAHFIISTPADEEYQYYIDNFEKYDFGAFLLSKQDFELLKEVLL